MKYITLELPSFCYYNVVINLLEADAFKVLSICSPACLFNSLNISVHPGRRFYCCKIWLRTPRVNQNDVPPPHVSCLLPPIRLLAVINVTVQIQYKPVDIFIRLSLIWTFKDILVRKLLIRKFQWIRSEQWAMSGHMSPDWLPSLPSPPDRAVVTTHPCI